MSEFFRTPKQSAADALTTLTRLKNGNGFLYPPVSNPLQVAEIDLAIENIMDCIKGIDAGHCCLDRNGEAR